MPSFLGSFRAPLGVACLAAVLLSPAAARAGRTASAEDARDDALTAGDVDAADLAAYPALARHAVPASTVRTPTWVSLDAFTASTVDGRREVGLMAVVGVAFDRLGEVGRARSTGAGIADGPSPAPAPPPGTPSPIPMPAPDPPILAIGPALARGAVNAAWRAAGLGPSDTAIDAIVTRARASALLPEARLRAMRVGDEAAHTESTSEDARYYDASGTRLWLEARLTWRLDRLLYADDEPALERLRLERQDVRTRIAVRVLDLLVQWERARLDLRAADLGARGETEAALRLFEAEAALDVHTAGWFTAVGEANLVRPSAPPAQVDARPPATRPAPPAAPPPPSPVAPPPPHRADGASAHR